MIKATLLYRCPIGIKRKKQKQMKVTNQNRGNACTLTFKGKQQNNSNIELLQNQKPTKRLMMLLCLFSRDSLIGTNCAFSLKIDYRCQKTILFY